MKFEVFKTPGIWEHRTIKFNGKKRSRTEWAYLLGITTSALTYRLKKWSKKKALTIPSPQEKEL